MLTHPTYQPR